MTTGACVIKNMLAMYLNTTRPDSLLLPLSLQPLFPLSKWDNVITPTLNTPTIITPTLNTSTVTDSLCNSGAFRNPNTVRDCPFNLKGAWFVSRSRKFFSYAALLFLKLFSAAQHNFFYKRKYYFM
jgi:hypothetical protein